MTRPSGGDRGAVATEFAVIMAAFLTSFVLIVVFAGRVATAENDVQSAAQEAARSASLAPNAEQAIAAAQATTEANLALSGVACGGQVLVEVGIEEFRPGGWVRVAVTCESSVSDLSGIGIPGSRTFASEAIEVIDNYRSEGP